ncbi:MAG: magnesium transporter [Desulfobacteraceae bacterium]|nr:magnesium transporter [Desulfobacteraceae bacterium]
MQTEQLRILTVSIKRLLRRGATRQLKNIIAKTHMADLSIVFKELSMDNRKRLFKLLEDPEQMGLLLSELEENTFLEYVKQINLSILVEIFNTLPSDDAAELLNMLDEELSDQILSKMQKEESDNVEQLMSYDEDTAGSLMVQDFVALEEETKAREVIEALQSKYLDVEMPFYIYVIDDYGKLVGVSSLRQLVVVPPEKPLKEFMATDIITATPFTDREDVAKLVSKYDYLAIPVVDDDNKMIGIVTVDDVIDILHEAATEDMLKMAGVGEEYVETQTVFRGTRIRLPWLFASFLGGLAAVFILNSFESALGEAVYLAAFIPVIMGMGGNIGTQSSTIVVRGIATGKIDIQDFAKIVGKELAVGTILGIVYGVFIGVVAKILYAAEPFSWSLAIAVGLGIISSMSIASLVGSMIPLIMERFNIDPAVATGPFVTTSVDIVSVYCYFMIATLLIGL